MLTLVNFLGDLNIIVYFHLHQILAAKHVLSDRQLKWRKVVCLTNVIWGTQVGKVSNHTWRCISQNIYVLFKLRKTDDPRMFGDCMCVWVSEREKEFYRKVFWRREGAERKTNWKCQVVAANKSFAHQEMFAASSSAEYMFMHNDSLTFGVDNKVTEENPECHSHINKLSTASIPSEAYFTQLARHLGSRVSSTELGLQKCDRSS